MRILVNGVTSDVGRAFARAALAAGHEVSGVGAEDHIDLEPAVSLTIGDSSDAVALVPDCDVVVHLVPVEREVPDSGGIPALRMLATAAARAGVRFVVPLAHGPDVADADRVVRDSGAEHVVVRTAPLGGRLLDWQACRTYATLLTAPRDTQWRLLHTDDLVRFLLHVIAGERTGVVSLAAPGVITPAEARGPLRGVTPTPSVRGIPCWPEMSTLDRKNSAREWGFECGWTSEEVLDDLARGARGRALGRDGAVALAARLPIPCERPPRGRPPADETILNSVALPSIATEFDDRVDPRFPVFDANRTAETFPEPLTPLSIDVHTAGLRAADRVIGQVMGLSGPLALEWEVRAHAVFGHRIYAGVSAAVAVAPVLPGWNEKTVVERAFDGEGSGEIDLHPEGSPALPTGPRRLAAKLAATYRFLGVVRRYRSAARQFSVTAAGEHFDDELIAGLSDAALDARARLLRDRLSQGWVLCGLGALVERTCAKPLGLRARGAVEVLGRGANVAGEAAFVEVVALAERLRDNRDLREAAEKGDLDELRDRFPEFAIVFDEAVTRIGHRGPGETELSNRTYAERPELLLAAAVGTAREPIQDEQAKPRPAPEPATAEEPTEDSTEKPTEESAEESAEQSTDEPAEDKKIRRGLTGMLAAAGRRNHDVARDATMRYTDELRRLVREWGRRQVSAAHLVRVEDVYYLTLDELLVPPADARALIERRRDELARLREVRLPAMVNGSWHPAAEPEPLAEGERLFGVAAAKGVVEGKVRVVPAVPEAGVEPGEILVTRVADLGHNALLGTAAAVVTDFGDVLSGVAVVAREAGIPCVVGAREASFRLATGATVRVDGDAGTVELLTPAPLPTFFAHR
jgi:rifampicin phosphotransferase